jgi:hypothetical protein
MTDARITAFGRRLAYVRVCTRFEQSPVRLRAAG